MDARQELVNRLQTIREQASQVSKEIEAIDYKERFDSASKYLGKFFKEKQQHKDYVRCFYVYEITKEYCEVISMQIHYWQTEYNDYSVEHSTYFNPSQHSEQKTEYEEITKEEFLTHYAEILERIHSVTSELPTA